MNIASINMFLKKGNWLFELLIIIVIISVINLCVVLIGYNNIFSIIISQIINIVGFIFLLFLARFHLIEHSGNNNNRWLNYLKFKLSITDFLIIFLIVILEKIFNNIMINIELINIFSIDIFTSKRFFVAQLSGFHTWIIISISIIMLTIGVFAEELYFRCYLFEMQYKQFKNYSWLINGFSWSIYHVFSPTNFLVLLPTCLLYSYAYQKRRNVWITITAHLIQNFIVFYPILKSYFL